jgi:formate dehydrogenase subunit delta
METRDMLRMANQIADFFKGYPREEARKEAATHLNNYWDPRMRKHLFGTIISDAIPARPGICMRSM